MRIAERAQHHIEQVLMRQHACYCSYSSGKDSSSVVALTLNAARNIKNKHPNFPLPLIMVTMADTGIENPEIAAYAYNEMHKILAFAQKHQLNIKVGVSKPLLNNSWAVSIIGGRTLPRFPGQTQDCTEMYKILPLKKLRNAMMKKYGIEKHNVVTLVGTRFSESFRRTRIKSE